MGMCVHVLVCAHVDFVVPLLLSRCPPLMLAGGVGRSYGPSRCNVYGMDSSGNHLDVYSSVGESSQKAWTSNTSFGGSAMPSAAACDDEAPVASAGKAWPEEDAPAAGA